MVTPFVADPSRRGLTGAALLGESLVEVDGDVDKLPGVFQPRIATWLDVPWRQATGYDFMFRTTAGTRPEPTPEQREMSVFMGVLSQIGTVDHTVVEALLVANQSFDPSLLRSPELEEKVTRWITDGCTPPTPDPQRPPEIAA